MVGFKTDCRCNQSQNTIENLIATMLISIIADFTRLQSNSSFIHGLEKH